MKNKLKEYRTSKRRKLWIFLFIVILTIPSSFGQACTSINASNFNGTPISAGNYIWFNANFTIKTIDNKPPVCDADNPLIVNLSNSFVTFTANGIPYTLAVPDAEISFNTATVSPSTTWSAATGYETAIPCSNIKDDEVFLSGFAIQVPAGGFPGGINPVTWQGDFYASRSIEISWKWSAAVYTQFSTNYNNLNIELVHLASGHAGDPKNYKNFVIGGARGGGGSNFTGSFSSTKTVEPCDLIPLPVTFTSFTAARKGENVVLNWETATEQNCKEYFVQQKIGSEWQDLGGVPSRAAYGNSNTTLKYSFSHPYQDKEISYYRIKQVDLDNSVHFSPTRSVQHTQQSREIIIEPNPALNGVINVRFDRPSVRDITATDLAGHIILKDLAVTNRNWQHENLPPGIYLIQISDKNSGKFSSEKVMVK